MQGIEPPGAAHLLEANQGIPRDREGPVFREPWEAQAFAMALLLNEAGVFSWSEWGKALGKEIARARAAGDPDRGDTYYRHWLAALEGILTEKGVTTCAQLSCHRRAWQRAAERTPHGKPIEPTADDYR